MRFFGIKATGEAADFKPFWSWYEWRDRRAAHRLTLDAEAATLQALYY
jgi:hypothetical protein